MDFDSPDDDAYGRSTNPDRFQVVIDAARNLIDDLAVAFDVVVEPDSPVPDIPYWVASTETIRIVPRWGAPLTFGLADPPAVFVRAGEWGVEPFPFCACDACDVHPDDAIAEMTVLVAAVTEGSYEEQLTKRRLRTGYGSRGRQRRRDGRLERSEWRRYGTPGSPTWGPWPQRQPTGPDS